MLRMYDSLHHSFTVFLPFKHVLKNALLAVVMSDPRDYVIKKTEDTNYIILTESSDIEHHSLSRKTLNLRQRKQPQSYRCKLHTFSYKFIF